MMGLHRLGDRAGYRRHRLLLATAVAGTVATVAVVFFPAVHFAYRSPEFHVALETAAGLTAALAALLFYGRLRDGRQQNTGIALIYALVVSALVNVSLSVVPSIAQSQQQGSPEWAAIVGRLVSTAAFAYAAFSHPPSPARHRSRGWFIIGAAVATVVAVRIVVGLLEPVLPTAVLRFPEPGSGPSLASHPSLLLIQGLSLLLFTAAAVGFSRRATMTGDGLLHWLAAGALLSAFSRLHYSLYPSVYAEWVYSGDILRLGFYGLMLAGAIWEIRRYWAGLAVAAAERERRRLARDLHDGVAQELAYVVTQVRRLAAKGAPDEARTLIGAAERALDESRRAIAALSRDADEPFDVALTQAAEEVAQRVGTTVRLRLDPVEHLTPASREALIRIAREAIINAGRHSGADQVDVELISNGRVTLAIRDQGSGFDASQVGPNRFGLVSMRERAEALHAQFNIESSPGKGTSVEVLLDEQ